MKKTMTLMICLLTCAIAWAMSGEIFPRLEGWRQGDATAYMPQNLYEYINGAAEVYLSYDFQKLLTLTYENEKNQSITVDVYRHSDPTTAFGIYSQEKPQTGDFLNIGTQGYYETGVLNFFRGATYVKLTGFDLDKEDRFWLEKTARMLDNNLEGPAEFPEIVACFPERGKIENSERYILKNFLGHSFLHSAFVADYRSDEKKFQIFIIETDSQSEARDLVNNYLNFLKSKDETPAIDDQNTYRFQDPYYRSGGTMGFRWKNNIIWGFFHKDPDLFRSYLEDIEKNLKARGLVQ